jgi:hypothetical protein
LTILNFRILNVFSLTDKIDSKTYSFVVSAQFLSLMALTVIKLNIRNLFRTIF